MLFISGCTSTSVRQPLLDEEIRVRPQGFTNQICLERKFDGTCTKIDVAIFDLSIADTRARLREVELICDVAGKRYRVCGDEPCIYTQHEEVKRFLGIPVSRKIVVDDKIYMPQQLQKLLDTQTYCAPQGSASEGMMQWN